MPYDDLAELIASLRYNRGQVIYHAAAEERARIGSERRYHREECSVAAIRCTEIITTLNANMSTGIDLDAGWPHQGEQIDAFLGAQKAVAA